MSTPILGLIGFFFYLHNNNATYFDSFGIEHIPKEIKTFIANKNITANVFRIQAYD